MQADKSKVFTLRLPSDLRTKLEKRAEKEGRSLANLIIFLLWKGVENE